MTFQRETLKYYLNDIHGALWGDIVWGTTAIRYTLLRGLPILPSAENAWK